MEDTKLTEMLILKRVLRKLRNYVYRKNVEFPHNYWREGRMILFIKAVRHMQERRKKENRLRDLAVAKRMQLDQKVMKQVMVALLQNIFEKKKRTILRATVDEFRQHKLQANTFKLFKIGCLLHKKSKILNQVAFEFRQKRIKGNQCHLVTISEHFPGSTIQTGEEPEEDKKGLMQRVFTAWLQFTLENFIKHKVVRNFQEYRQRKAKARVFKGWREAVVPNRYMQTPAEGGVSPVSHLSRS